jgi:uncharacterized protein (DUF302 family)
MKAILQSRMFWGVIGFLGGAVITNIGVVLTVRSLIVREYRSPLDFSSTVQTIASNAGSRGWKVSKAYEHPALPQSVNRNLGSVQLIELSHPRYTSEALQFGPNRCVAMTPQTLIVYEQNGQVFVSSVNNGVIGRFFRRQAAGPMTKVRGDEKEILEFLTRR